MIEEFLVRLLRIAGVLLLVSMAATVAFTVFAIIINLAWTLITGATLI